MEDMYDDELCMYMDGEPIDTDICNDRECIHCSAIFTPYYSGQIFCEMCNDILTDEEKEEICNGN